MRTTDVLVAGAGPVGLMMACELRRHGVNCRIIDPLPELANQCKAIGIQPRTLEVWEDMGIAPPTRSMPVCGCAECVCTSTASKRRKWSWICLMRPMDSWPCRNMRPSAS